MQRDSSRFTFCLCGCPPALGCRAQGRSAGHGRGQPEYSSLVKVLRHIVELLTRRNPLAEATRQTVTSLQVYELGLCN